MSCPLCLKLNSQELHCCDLMKVTLKGQSINQRFLSLELAHQNHHLVFEVTFSKTFNLKTRTTPRPDNVVPGTCQSQGCDA